MMKRENIINRQFDEERALYHLMDTVMENCTFAGPADGESVLKEDGNIKVVNSHFSLRYPMWHDRNFLLEHSVMDELTRAALWYAKNGEIKKCELNGIKAVRECAHIHLSDCRIDSAEFGWKCDDITLTDSEINSEYLFFDSKNVRLKNVKMKGKYSFQYMENLEITNSVLDTKDAFWHSKNVIVRNCTVKGEYLAWFSDGLTLIDCKIIGTQPFCYCTNLTLKNCTMENCDLAFEYSDVTAEVRSHIDSVKNPKSGTIVAKSVGEVIMGDSVMECNGKVVVSDC